MKLYATPLGSWAGTQADAKALAKAQGSSWAEQEVPVDKAGLLAFLNRHAVGRAVRLQETREDLKAPETRQEPERPTAATTGPARADMSCTATLSRMDNPGVDVDGIVETVSKARGYALKRYAGAVAVAFQAISLGN